MKKTKIIMKKQIRQVTGTATGITFTKEEKNIYDMKVGDILDISDMFVIKQKKKND